MFTLRKATLHDLDFLVEVDRKDEGCTSTYLEDWDREALAKQRDKIASFVSDDDQATWIYEHAETGGLIGVILWRYRNRRQETFEAWNAFFLEMEERLFLPDGAFCEIFQLWISPAFRRLGLASNLKRQAEAEALRRGVKTLYTHTEERNLHVVEMNIKLGYHEVRRGPMWDEIIRVSLVKTL